MNFSKIATLIALTAVLAIPTASYAMESRGSADLSQDIIVNPYNDMGRPFPPATTGVAIGANGQTFVRGATVQSVSPTSVTAQSTLGSSVLNWVLSVGTSTKVAGSKGAATTADIKAGDTLSFTGILTSIGSIFAVNAQMILDSSLSSSTHATTTFPKPEPYKDGMHVGFWGWLGAHLGFGSR